MTLEQSVSRSSQCGWRWCGWRNGRGGTNDSRGCDVGGGGCGAADFDGGTRSPLVLMESLLVLLPLALSAPFLDKPANTCLLSRVGYCSLQPRTLTSEQFIFVLLYPFLCFYFSHIYKQVMLSWKAKYFYQLSSVTKQTKVFRVGFGLSSFSNSVTLTSGPLILSLCPLFRGWSLPSG